MTGWKTVVFGAALALAGFLETVKWVDIIPSDPHTAGLLTTAVGGIVIVLRWFTSTAIGKS